jgi:glyoxalase superfamily protein
MTSCGENRSTLVGGGASARYRPPTWPDSEVAKQIHLDLAVDDLDAAEAEATRLGARRAETQPTPNKWRVMLDPAGHPFCLCDWGQSSQS